MVEVREIRHAHFFCGLGGGARGFNRGTARVGNMEGRFRCIGGIDVDAASIRDFEQLAGVRGTVLDLFSLEQYRAFHGREPPAGWREASTADVHAAFGHERPHIVFLSAPCKGFSGLLAESVSATAKYQALNGLTLRGVWLMLEAFADDPAELIVFENVPRIATRGRRLLDQIKALLSHYGYVVAETTHDCGELGGLAQSRKRFLLVARHAAKVPPFLYEPRKMRLRGVGEVLEHMPLPGDPAGGPMHRIPALQWRTWVRLAFVEAGSDWRSLNRLRVEDGVLADFGILPERRPHNGAYGVTEWAHASGVVTGESRPPNGKFAVADPRAVDAGWNADVLGVRDWETPTGTVAGRSSPTNGAFSVADPRQEHWGTGQLGVSAWDEPAPTLTSQRAPGQGRFSVADPRPTQANQSYSQYGVRTWNDHASAVTGQATPGGGAHAVADPRIGQDGPRFNNVYRIVPWSAPSPAVTGGGGNSAAAVADPRPSQREDYKQTKYRLTGFGEAAGTVIAASTTGNGGFAVADPRTGFGPGSHQNKLKVLAYDEPGSTVTGSDRVGSGALSVADPRPRLGSDAHRYHDTQGHYGVLPWGATSGAVPAYAKHDNGRWSVADPRDAEGEPATSLPAAADRLVAVIRALDGTWHRPFTTLELAALQSLFDPEEAFSLDGASDSAWRERIGNAVPSDAAAAIASVMGRTLLMAWAGESFALSMEPIWVQPLAIALAVDVPLGSAA